ncbi:MAG: glycosyltransferase family 2 protein [Henriciella sp.]|nr:glycosyltransferase family 2 protein [Henriciella sp.]
MADQLSNPAQVLVVIPTLNEEAHIESCIRSLLVQDGQNCAIVVCDGLSTDRTREIVMSLQDTYPELKFLENEKRLQSAAINHAVATHATSETRYIVRCDAHSSYPENFISRVVAKLQETEAASVVTVMDSVGSTCFERANAWAVDTPLGSGGAAHRAGATSGYVDHGHHAGFDIDWFRRIGGYDETFTHNEDAEYDHRLGLAGGKVYLDADIRIEYTPRGSLAALMRQYYNYGKGRARTTLKHRMRPKIRQMVPVLALLGVIFGIALLPVTPWLALIPLSYLLLLSCVSVAFAVAKKSVCGFWTGPALATMHMSWGWGFLAGLIKFGTRHARRDVLRTANAEEK